MKALILTRTDQQVVAQLGEYPLEKSPLDCSQAVKIRVEFASLNYKDALAITGAAPIVRQYPFVPGIDLVGTVLASPSAQFEVGQKVLCTGFGYGENHFGGLTEMAYIAPHHLTHLPPNLTAWQAMAIGTAGFTAMLAVNALLAADITPNKGEVLVTGASGGVGSIAIKLLSQLGYQIGAVSGKAELSGYLQQLGAKQVYPRQQFEQPPRLLDKQCYAGVIDTVGGKIFANILSKLAYNGCAVACGLAHCAELPTSVMPFILRNVRLQGIDSVYYPIEKRDFIWQQLANALDESFYSQAVQTISLDQAVEIAQKMVKGQHQGRFVVSLNA